MWCHNNKTKYDHAFSLIIILLLRMVLRCPISHPAQPDVHDFLTYGTMLSQRTLRDGVCTKTAFTHPPTYEVPPRSQNIEYTLALDAKLDYYES